MVALKNPKFKKVIFVLTLITLGIVILFIACEISLIMYYLIKDKGYIPISERLLQEKNVYVRNITEKKDECSYLDTLFPHPYLAFVHHSNEPCGIEDINNIGLFGPDYRSEKYDDKYVILVTGGSVAAQFAQMEKDGPKYLQCILNDQYINAGKEFLILNGGDGAWKYPQQLILFILYADVIDAIITIDGFNEYYMLGSNLRFEYPANNFLEVNPTLNDGYIRLLGGFLRNKISNISKNNWFLSHSHFAYYLTKSLRKAVRSWEKSEIFDNSKTTIQSIFALPEDWNDEKKFYWSIGQYKKYIRMINYIAKDMNIKVSHFIQPVPAIHKKLTIEEKSVVGDLSYGEVYFKMTDELLTLRNEAIPIFSLLDIFENVSETIYMDQIHCNKSPSGESLGYKIMAERIAKVIEKTWGLVKRHPTSIKGETSSIIAPITKKH